jgi:ssDNA-binding Zn-finger/Zn-ribbon topoisomerase 1
MEAMAVLDVPKRFRLNQQDPADQIPTCPKCGRVMVLRTVKSGKNTGRQFWGCMAYPDCKGLVDL